MALKKPVHALLTRPTHQCETLTALCKARGLTVSHLPCIAIEPSIQQHQHSEKIVKGTTVLFTSRNAVIHAHQYKPLPWRNVHVHAIGSATANALAQFQQDLEISPQPPFTSEAYLSRVAPLEQRTLVIIKGEGGRSHIAQQLQQLGWSVSSWNVYRRTLPSFKPVEINRVFNPLPPDVIFIGSNETLTNLLHIAENYRDRILQTPLIVNSQRCYDLVRTLNPDAQCMVSNPAGDLGQVAQLDKWLANTT